MRECVNVSESLVDSVVHSDTQYWNQYEEDQVKNCMLRPAWPHNHLDMMVRKAICPRRESTSSLSARNKSPYWLNRSGSFFVTIN
jgi:hypothetical protein